MAQNVTIAGNQYPSVPSIQIPKTGGGGNATFTDTSPTTASASDVAQGKIFFDSTGTQQTGTASGGSAVIQPLSVTQNGTYTAPTGVDGYSPVTVTVSGGGASNVVTGTFTGTTTGAAMNITLNYSGSGYPVAVIIYPKEGMYNSSEGTWYSLLQRYAVGVWCGIKANMNKLPSYISPSGDENQMTVLLRYKSSASSATSYSNAGVSNIQSYIDNSAVSTNTSVVRLRSATKMSVFIANTSYGFAANIEYTYHVIYSS